MASRQDIWLSITPKILASFSIPSSLFIIYEAMSDHRKGKGTAIQRALVGMSVVDVWASFAWWLSTWAVPVGMGNPLAKGNVASCNFQGFLLQFAVGAPLYNCSLALYYLLVIRYNWNNAQLVKIERFVHVFIIVFTVGTSIAGLPLTMYNRVGSVCWVIGSPPECGSSSTGDMSDIPCDRGDYAWIFGIALFYGPLWISVLATVIAMLLIYLQVRRTFAKSRTHGFTVDDNGLGAVANNSSRDSGLSPNRGMRDSRFSRLSVFRLSVVDDKSEVAIRESSRESDISESNRQITGTDSWMASNNNASETVRERQKRRKRNKQSMFATQAILYSGSFFITWSPSTIWSIGRWFNVSSFTLDMLAAICEPLQGFWNMLIFIRRRPSSQQKLKRIFAQPFCNLCILMFPCKGGGRSFTEPTGENNQDNDVASASCEVHASTRDSCEFESNEVKSSTKSTTRFLTEESEAFEPSTPFSEADANEESDVMSHMDGGFRSSQDR